MSCDGYVSCANCHIEGGSDGRIWDFRGSRSSGRFPGGGFQVERSALSHAVLPEDFTRALDQCAADGNGVPEKPTLATRVRRTPGLLVRAPPGEH